MHALNSLLFHFYPSSLLFAIGVALIEDQTTELLTTKLAPSSLPYSTNLAFPHYYCPSSPHFPQFLSAHWHPTSSSCSFLCNHTQGISSVISKCTLLHDLQVQFLLTHIYSIDGETGTALKPCNLLKEILWYLYYFSKIIKSVRPLLSYNSGTAGKLRPE